MKGKVLSLSPYCRKSAKKMISAAVIKSHPKLPSLSKQRTLFRKFKKSHPKCGKSLLRMSDSQLKLARKRVLKSIRRSAGLLRKKSKKGKKSKK